MGLPLLPDGTLIHVDLPNALSRSVPLYRDASYATMPRIDRAVSGFKSVGLRHATHDPVKDFIRKNRSLTSQDRLESSLQDRIMSVQPGIKSQRTSLPRKPLSPRVVSVSPATVPANGCMDVNGIHPFIDYSFVSSVPAVGYVSTHITA